MRVRKRAAAKQQMHMRVNERGADKFAAIHFMVDRARVINAHNLSAIHGD